MPDKPHSDLLAEGRRIAGWAPDKPESVHEVLCSAFKQLDAQYAALQAAIELIQNERDADRPGMYEDGKIVLEHAATVQAELQRLYEQLEAERKAWRKALDSALQYVPLKDHDFIEAIVSNPAKERHE